MMQDESYRRSVVRAVRQARGLTVLGNILAELPAKVAGMWPYDVVALTGVTSQVDYLSAPTGSDVLATTLALRGYDSRTALGIWEQFRRNFKAFDGHMLMLMSKQALVETYGSFNGELLAQTLTDPRSQPVLHALLFADPREADVKGDIAVAVERDCVSARFKCRTNLDVQNPTRNPGDPRDVEVTPWEHVDDALQVLPPHVAAHAYDQATEGGRLPSKVAIHIPLSTYFQIPKRAKR